MAILANDTARTVVQVVLAIVIVVLGFMLYSSIRGPQALYEREQDLTAETRERMGYVRDAMRNYEFRYNRYPTTLDSLVTILRTDPFFAAKRDSIFDLRDGRTLDLDSLIYSPRTGERFDLDVVRDDSTGVRVYLLEDPASDDFVGTDNPARAAGMLNAASWE